MSRRRGKLAALTVYTCAFGVGKAIFGYTFCHTPARAKSRARQEAFGIAKELFLPLLGTVAEIRKRVWVNQPLIIRIADVGFEIPERQALTQGKDAVVFMSWLEDVMEPMLLSDSDEAVGFSHVYKD